MDYWESPSTILSRLDYGVNLSNKQSMPLQPGEAAPDFSLKDQNGKIRSNKRISSKYLILFFYPKDNTPGCTAQACSFKENYESLKRLGAQVLGVSSDSQDSHRDFATNYNLEFPLLCDEGGALRTSFGLNKVFGIIPSRVTYIINRRGIIEHVFSNLLDGPAHVSDAISFLSEIQAKGNK